MIRLGMALKSTEYPYHRCVILSDPQANGGQVVLVRVTTDDGSWPDRDCVLTPADWSALEHPSTVAYSTCKCGPAVAALEKAIRGGAFVEIDPPSDAVLGRMIETGRLAVGMPPIAKRWLA
jgi:hypothetical protein